MGLSRSTTHQPLAQPWHTLCSECPRHQTCLRLWPRVKQSRRDGAQQKEREGARVLRASWVQVRQQCSVCAGRRQAWAQLCCGPPGCGPSDGRRVVQNTAVCAMQGANPHSRKHSTTRHSRSQPSLNLSASEALPSQNRCDTGGNSQQGAAAAHRCLSRVPKLRGSRQQDHLPLPSPSVPPKPSPSPSSFPRQPWGRRNSGLLKYMLECIKLLGGCCGCCGVGCAKTSRLSATTQGHSRGAARTKST